MNTGQRGMVVAGCLLALGLSGAGPAALALQDWAFPARAKPGETTPEPAAPRTEHLVGSRLSFTADQLSDLYHAVDWWPERHPTPPASVVQGHAPGAMACGFCHLPAGEGRPENAALAGLPAAYIAAQVADMRRGAREAARRDWAPADLMHQVARAATPAEVVAAADYFARLKFTSRVRVVETAEIPAVIPDGFVYKRVPGGGRVRLGARIVEAPDDFARFELRDSTLSYTAYVPPGSIARGRDLALSGGQGRTQACAACHGASLTGALGPPLAGRGATYLYRQIYGFQSGDRNGAGAAPMKQVTARLSTGDMIDLAAYVASLKPR